MNMAILIPTLSMGGAERVAAFLGNYYHDRGNKVYYFLFANCGRPFFSVKGEIVKTHTFFSVFAQNHSENIREMLFAAKKFSRLKKKYEIDVAVSFMEDCNFINICSKGKEKVFVSVRTVLSARPEYSGFLLDERWIRNLYKRADKIIAVSNYVKKDLSEQYRISARKIVAIPNISVRRESAQEKTFPWEYGDRAIVCVGRFDPVKQHERLIRAFSYTYEKLQDARLVLVGDGKQKSYLKLVCKKLGLENGVVFAGASGDVGYFLGHARAFAMSSRVEGFPNVMVEAMAYGVPVVTTDSPGGCGEIVGKKKDSDEIQYCEYGILTPRIEGEMSNQTEPGREEKLLGEALLRLLEDDDLYRKYSDKAKRRAKDFSEDKIMAIWDEVLFGRRVERL